jgi:hypothetical protein
MQATFRNHSTSQEVTLELRGDMWGGSADISMGGMPVAQITRQLFNMREVFADKQTVSRRGGLDGVRATGRHHVGENSRRFVYWV